MKRIYFFTLITCFITGSLYSQQAKNEIYGAYGLASVQEIASILADVIIYPFVPEDFTIVSPVGPVIAGYRRNLSEHFSIGMQGSYTAFNKEYTVLSSAKLKIVSTFITAMLNTNYCYNPRNVVQFYSGLSAGLSVFTQTDSLRSDNKTVFAFHVNAIGIRVGKTFGGLLELGFGFNGIINGGLSVKF